MSEPGHPDDELLSAALDGHEREAAAHARRCPACGARMTALQAAAQALAAPLPLAAPAVRDAAVRRAVHEGRAGPSPARPGWAARGWRAGAGRRAPGRARWATLGAAAAVAVAVAVTVLLSRGAPSTQSASRARPRTASAPVVLDGGDLGPLADQVALRDTVRRQLDSAGAPPSPAPAPAAAQDGPGDAQRSSPFAAGGAAGAPGASSVPGPGGPRPPGPARPPPGPLASAAPCRGAAQQYGGPRLGALVYVAALRWQGTPGEVLVFHAASGSLPYRLFVMARVGCELLVAQSF